MCPLFASLSLSLYSFLSSSPFSSFLYPVHLLAHPAHQLHLSCWLKPQSYPSPKWAPMRLGNLSRPVAVVVAVGHLHSARRQPANRVALRGHSSRSLCIPLRPAPRAAERMAAWISPNWHLNLQLLILLISPCMRARPGRSPSSNVLQRYRAPTSASKADNSFCSQQIMLLLRLPLPPTPSPAETREIPKHAPR